MSKKSNRKFDYALELLYDIIVIRLAVLYQGYGDFPHTSDLSFRHCCFNWNILTLALDHILKGVNQWKNCLLWPHL